VADRGRNDWLLELGRRQDWVTFLRIQPQFRMADDREVACWDVLARYQTRPTAQPAITWRSQAQQAWWDQKDADQACDRMASALLKAGVLTPDDVWHKLRLVVETNKPKAVQQSARHLGDAVAQVAARLMTAPQAVLQPGALTAPLMSAGEPPSGAPGASMGPPSSGTKASKKPATSVLRKKQLPKPTLASIPLTIPPESEGPLNLLAFIRWASVDHAAAAAPSPIPPSAPAGNGAPKRPPGPGRNWAVPRHGGCCPRRQRTMRGPGPIWASLRVRASCRRRGGLVRGDPGLDGAQCHPCGHGG